MRTLLIFLFAATMLLGSCKQKSKTDLIEKSKTEILTTEKAFAAMAKKEGIAAAFAYFAADDAIINYNDKLIKGKNDIMAHYSDKKYNDATLEWTPDFVDASGDLGYTYGTYTYIKKDSTGKTETFKGIFHTVWKKQADGTWRFVWD